MNILDDGPNGEVPFQKFSTFHHESSILHLNVLVNIVLLQQRSHTFQNRDK